MKTFEVNGRNQSYEVTIKRNKSITIACTYLNHSNPRPTTITFRVGDTAEYDSYNLSYTGEIVSITEKTVSIQPNGDRSIRRLKLVDFCWRNWDFNAEKIAKENFETMMYI